jgi:hypothetical protein
MRRVAGAVLAAMVLLLGHGAYGQPVDDATRGAARAMGQEGLDAFDAGKYEEAAEKLGAAFDVIQVPTLGLWLARSLVKTGKLVEASERYGEVTRLKVQPNQQEDTQKQAQAEAAQERVALQPRIPTLRVQVEGADAKAVEVTVEGVKVPTALLAAPRPTNPGKRVVQGKLGDQVVTEEVTLAEGESRTVVLKFGAPPVVAAPPKPAAVPVPPELAPAPVQDAGVGSGSDQRIAGYVSLGVGGVGLVLGVVTGLVAQGKKTALEDAGCVGGHCYPSQQDDVDSYNSMRTFSTVGFIAGGVGIAAGVTLLLTAPKDQEHVALWLGPTSAGVKGRF